jgi:two-component system, OmpR family, copper resistance phosphate regulon response regulator CusR
MRVLVVEDQAELADDIADGLRDQGIGADVAYDGPTGIEKALMNSYDVVVLDRDLPKVHGDAVCATLVGSRSAARILMLTAAATVGDRVQGLNLGADDYLGKPFAFEELLARVRALVRRPRGGSGTVLTHGDVRVDLATHRADRAGKPLDLTAKEQSLLVFFLRHPDEVLSRTRIYEHVWDERYDGTSNTLEVHVMELRRKLEARGPRLIHTLRGRGYLFGEPPGGAEAGTP